jgi:hypothetical protein
VGHGNDDPDDPDAGEGGQASVELFNLKDDPYESKNLADREPRKVEELRRTLASYARQAVPPKSRPRPKGFVVPKVWGEAD